MATEVAKFKDLFFSTIGIFNLFFNLLCTFSGTPALSLPNY
jgi:hypothetical protein